MASLKAFLPQISKVLSVSADALYSRQRALVDLGVLKSVAGRGPGSGTPLDGAAVAGLIIALLMADTLQDTDHRVRLICSAAPADSARCPWTGESDFQSTLAAILTSNDRMHSIASVIVYRHVFRSQILYGRPDDSLTSRFKAKSIPKGPAPSISLQASMDAKTLKSVAAMLQAEMAALQ